MNWCSPVLLSVDLAIERLDELISELDIPGLVSFRIGPVGLVLRASYSTHENAKNAVIFHTQYHLFLTTATIFSTVFYMSNDLLTKFF